MATSRVNSVVALALLGLPFTTRTLASDMWDNRSVRIVQTAPANFPPALAAEGVSEGEVRAVLNVDADGKLVDCLVTAYTRPELADELSALVKSWSYEPARQRGTTVGSRVDVTFTFEARGMVVSLAAGDTFAAATNRLVRPVTTTLLCRPMELDEPVRALQTLEPQHPGDRVALRSARPAVTIDFYIDMDGRTRMPVVLRATHELYAVAAVDALMQWRFTPPLRRGQPAIVRATQLFRLRKESMKSAHDLLRALGCCQHRLARFWRELVTREQEFVG